MKTMFKGFVAMCILCFALPALAGSIREYTADMVDVKSGKAVARYAVTEKKMRAESLEKGDSSISIIRLDQGKMYALQDDKTYLEFPLQGDRIPTPQEMGGMMMGGSGPKTRINREKLGTETVSGYEAEKFRVTATIEMMGHKHSSTHLEWIAKEFAIPVRTESDGKVVEMRNIQIGAPAGSLFEIPAGYTKNAGLEDMMKKMKSGKF